jgi:hypothetical protein
MDNSSPTAHAQQGNGDSPRRGRGAPSKSGGPSGAPQSSLDLELLAAAVERLNLTIAEIDRTNPNFHLIQFHTKERWAREVEAAKRAIERVLGPPDDAE